VKLADLRRAAVKNNARVHFQSGEGMECVVTERGLAEVPGLRRAPGFNLEVELAAARKFVVESNGESKPVSREEIERWAAAGPAAAQHDDHDE
jgi:hypothetical protein